jgi:uncharacterized surface anchored protein
MKSLRTIGVYVLAILLASVCAAQKKSKLAAEKLKPTTGSVKGKVRVDNSSTPEGVHVTLRRGEEEIARGETDRKGEFVIANVAPGVYSLVFRKAGLETGEVKSLEIKPGKTVSLERIFLPIDEGAIAFVKGSVFTAEGRSLEGARVELLLINADGSTKKIDGRVTNESGQFSFRLKPTPGRYRVTAKGEGGEAAQEVEIEGALVYRVALSLKK